jgi:hypothetical protein
VPFLRRLAAASLLALLIAPVAVWVGGTTPAAAAATADVFCGDRPVTEPPPVEALESFEARNPLRVVDTRDGTGGVKAAIGTACTLRLDLAGSPVPADAGAIALSVTALADRGGYFTVYPCASGRPETSNLNARVGVPTPNLVVALLDSARTVCIYSDLGGHLVIDLVGWWGAGPDRFSSIDPSRVYDTRELPGGARLPAGHIRNVPIGGKAVPIEATAAIVNLTVTGAANAGWLQAYPCGNAAPLASNLNYLAGEPRAVTAIVGLGKAGADQGQLCVRSYSDVHVIVDVVGYYAPGPEFGPSATVSPLRGDRLIDTRDGTGGNSTRFAAGQIRRFDPVAARSDAAEASAVLLNVIAVQPSSAGYLRVYPCTSDEPTTSSVNFVGGENASNLVPVELSSAREVCIYAYAETDVVVDLFGVTLAPEGSLVERLSFDATVWPTYDVEGGDYGVVCGSGSTQLQMEVNALPHVSVTVDGATPGDRHVSLAVTEDDVTTVAVSRGTERSTFYFRCLPADFPQLDVDKPGDPSPGWYLTTFGQSAPAPGGRYTVILDERGGPVWYKRNDVRLLDAKVTQSGSISLTSVGQFFGTATDDVSRRFYDLAGNLLDDRRISDPSLPVDHHDYIDLPGGSGAFVSYPLRHDVDLTALGAGFNVDDAVVDGAIVETDADGDVTWMWNSANHFPDDASRYPQRFARYPSPAEVTNGGEVDIVHINSIDRVDDGSGDYIVSARHLDTVFRVSRSTKDVIWTLGPAISTDDDAQRLELVGDPLGGSMRQHDARFDDGVLTMFDNHTAAASGSARAVAYEIDTSNANPAQWSATMLWERRQSAAAQSGALGSVRTASDGSVLIGWGTPLQPMFEELDAAGERLLAMSQVPGGNSYRIVKYSAVTFDRDTLRAQAGGDLEVPASGGP